VLQRAFGTEWSVNGPIRVGRLSSLLQKIKEWPDDVDWHRKDDCGILFGTDLGKCLKVSKLHGGRNTAEDFGGVDEGL